jgi:Meiotically up-regulated gene 113
MDMSAPLHWVYLIACQGWTKVGYTNNPKYRRDQLQTANPYELKLTDQFEYGDEATARAAEVGIRDYLRQGNKRQRSGEWTLIDHVTAGELAREFRRKRGAYMDHSFENIRQRQAVAAGLTMPSTILGT